MNTFRASIGLRNRRAGLTLVEVMVSATLLTLMMLGLMGLNTMCRSFVRAQRETALSSYTAEHAIEDLRAKNWSIISNADGVKTWLASLSGDGLSQLGNPRVRITIAPYPPLTPAPDPIIVDRAANGTCTIVSQPPSDFSLRSLLAVRVDFQLKWTSANGNRERVREIASVVSLSGLLK
jgi:hypothetical protein